MHTSNSRGMVAFQHARRRREFGAPLADAMHLDMISVAVAAVGRVAEQQVRVFLAEDRRESLRRFLDVRSPEAHPSRWIRVEQRAVTAVGVAEALDPIDTQNAGARLQFVQAETTFVVLNPPVGRGDDDHAMTACGRTRERAPGEDHLVVRVCVECDHGGHQTQYARDAERAPPGKK